MSDGWVNVYPIDECTAFHRQEVERLYVSSQLAKASAQSASQWLTCAVATVDAQCASAPLTAWSLSHSLSGAQSGPLGLLPLAAGADHLGESLRTARDVYAEAEWTLARTVEQYAAISPLLKSPGLRDPFSAYGSDAMRVYAMALLLYDRWRDLTTGGNAVGLQGDVREMGAHLRSLLQDGPWDLGVDTRDGAQSLADRGPVQGAALLLLSWSSLAQVTQTVTVRQVPAVGAATGEMETAVVPSIDGVPSALEWIKTTRSLSEDTGRIAMVSHQTEGGTAWTVLIPGTQALMGGANPQDWESNLELTAGLSSELMAGVVTAMRSAPIRPGDAVTLVGHSQGGIVATAMASNPEVTREFSVAAVVTAGSPVGQFDAVPEDVLALHLEDINDIVPAVDGLANTPRENHVTLVFDPVTVAPNPHGHDNYGALVETVRAQGNSPQLNRMTGLVGRVSGWGSGGEARLYTYEFERNETSPGIEEILVRKAIETVR